MKNVYLYDIFGNKCPNKQSETASVASEIKFKPKRTKNPVKRSLYEVRLKIEDTVLVAFGDYTRMFTCTCVSKKANDAPKELESRKMVYKFKINTYEEKEVDNKFFWANKNARISILKVF